MNRECIGTVVPNCSKKRKKQPDKQPASCQCNRLTVKFNGKRSIAVYQERTQSKQPQLLCTFFAATKDAEVFHLPALRGLLGMKRIPQKCEVRLAKECWHGAQNQSEKDPGREDEDTGRQANGRDDFLNQAAGGLNHPDAVRTLYTGTFQLVMEKGIFIRHQIERRGM